MKIAIDRIEPDPKQPRAAVPDRDFLLWLGGFFDGEGWVCFRNRATGRHFILGLNQAGDRGRAVLEEIVRATGVGQLRVYPRPGHQTCHDWRVTKVMDILWLGEMLLPHLRVKNQDLADMLATITSLLPTMKNMHWTTRELVYLRSHYKTQTLDQLGGVLHRTTKSVDGKLHELNIGQRRDQWARSRSHG